MKKVNAKKLALNSETISILADAGLGQVHGGGISIIIRTTVCPVLSASCGPCTVTIQTSGTSVINPSGG